MATWETEAEALADRIRRRARIGGKVPPSVIAKRLGYVVKVKKLEEGLDGYHLEGSRKLVVAEGYGPRQEASVAHELAEANLPERLLPELHERFCERVAAALLLPSQAYVDSLYASGWDVAQLRREVWRWASWEMLVHRASDLLPFVASAAWTDGAVKWRSPEEKPTPAELGAIDRASRGRGLLLLHGRLAVAWSLMPKGAKFRAVSLCLTVPR